MRADATKSASLGHVRDCVNNDLVSGITTRQQSQTAIVFRQQQVAVRQELVDAINSESSRPSIIFQRTLGLVDTLLMGRESAGLPEEVHAVADQRLFIPMAEGTRSLNIAIAAGMAVAEGVRQLRG